MDFGGREERERETYLRGELLCHGHGDGVLRFLLPLFVVLVWAFGLCLCSLPVGNGGYLRFLSAA